MAFCGLEIVFYDQNKFEVIKRLRAMRNPFRRGANAIFHHTSRYEMKTIPQKNVNILNYEHRINCKTERLWIRSYSILLFFTILGQHKDRFSSPEGIERSSSVCLLIYEICTNVLSQALSFSVPINILLLAISQYVLRRDKYLRINWQGLVIGMNILHR